MQMHVAFGAMTNAHRMRYVVSANVTFPHAFLFFKKEMTNVVVLDRKQPCGRGAYGIVFPGKDGKGQEVAVKCISIPKYNDWTGNVQLAREVLALRTFAHPHLLSLKGLLYTSLDKDSEIGLITARYDLPLSRINTDSSEFRRFIFRATVSPSNIFMHATLFTAMSNLKTFFVSSDLKQCVLGDFGLLQPAGSVEQESYVVASW